MWLAHRLQVRRRVFIAVVVVWALAAAMFLWAAMVTSGGGMLLAQQNARDACPAVVPGGAAVEGLSDEQAATALAILSAARDLNVPERGWVVALATAMQESTLRPLDYGHLDSVGPFQQRDAWGSRADRIDPYMSARMFFLGGQAGQRGLLGVAGWESMPLAAAAQAVQRSAFPSEYAKHEPLATRVVQALTGLVPAGQACGTGTGHMVGGYALPLPREHIHPPLPEHHDYPAVDIPVPVGTPVYAVAGGVVSYVGGHCGEGVGVTDAAGVWWLYCHASARLVRPGETVAAGQQIALAGSTGRSSGPHLHLQVDTPDGLRRCPQGWLNALVAGVVQDWGVQRTARPCV